MIGILPPDGLSWAAGRFAELPHALGPRVGLCLVDIPADVVVPADCVGPRERARAARMRDAREAAWYLASHAVLRGVLAWRLGWSPAVLEYRVDDLGKPRLADCPMGFNMSRSGPVALIGLVETGEIGVDVEQVYAQPDAASLARRHFSSREYAAWVLEEASRTDLAFLQCWTRKEACAKAVGLGLGLPLAQLDVGFDAPGAVCRAELPTVGRLSSAWVTSLAVPPGLVAAAAVIPS